MAKRSLLSVHIAVLLFGGSGLFIKLMPVSPLLLTLGRALFSALTLYIYIHYKNYSLRLGHIRDYFWNIVAGLLLTIHWFFFILSIQTSRVAIGTIAFATFPLFVVFIEPYVFKERFEYKNLIVVLLIALGVGFLIPAFQLNDETTLGIIFGLISSFSYAMLSIINRRLAASYESTVITLYEQTVSACVMTLIISLVNPTIEVGTVGQFIGLIVYGVIFTAVAHSLFTFGLKGIHAQTASIISVLEPVYSIFLAIIFLHERLAYQEIIGTAIIFIAVIIGMLIHHKSGVVEKNI